MIEREPGYFLRLQHLKKAADGHMTFVRREGHIIPIPTSSDTDDLQRAFKKSIGSDKVTADVEEAMQR